MVLEGVVTNVTSSRIVDIGVHQDGLVHISELSNDTSRSVRAVKTARSSR